MPDATPDGRPNLPSNLPPDVRPVRPGEELPLAQLQRHLQQQIPEMGDVPLEVWQFPHGHSNLTYWLRAGEHRWVLRRPPLGNQVKSAHDMGREYRVLEPLSRVYAAAPRPVLLTTDESILGAPFYLMEYRSGIILRNQWPAELPETPEMVRQLSESLVDQMLALHRLDIASAGLSQLGKPAGYVARQVRGWTERYQAARTRAIPSLERVAGWLAENLPAESAASLIHNDFKFDNVVFDSHHPSRIVAVLDWEMATLGDPLMDLGTSLAYWAQPGEEEIFGPLVTGPTRRVGCLTRREVLDRYLRQSELRPSGPFTFYYVYGLFKLAVIVQQIYTRFERGFTQDQRFARLGETAEGLGRWAERCSLGGEDGLG
jgi:aminoglycoside phosphotransferase (APT) family kinase protein